MAWSYWGDVGLRMWGGSWKCSRDGAGHGAALSLPEAQPLFPWACVTPRTPVSPRLGGALSQAGQRDREGRFGLFWQLPPCSSQASPGRPLWSPESPRHAWPCPHARSGAGAGG